MAVLGGTYDVVNDFLNSVVDVEAFDEEVRQSSISAVLDGTTVHQGSCKVYFDAALSGGDKTTLDGLVAAHTGDPVDPWEATHEENKYQSGNLVDTCWFASTDGAGAFSGLVRRHEYTYEKSTLLTETVTYYDRDGSVASTESFNFYTESVSKKTKKIRKERV